MSCCDAIGVEGERVRGRRGRAPDDNRVAATARSVGDEDDVRDREIRRVREAEQGARGAERGEEPRGFTMKLQLRGAACRRTTSTSRHVTPRLSPVPMAFMPASLAAKRAAYEAAAPRCFALAVGDFAGGVDSLAEAVAVLLEHRRDARHFGRVESD